jgi:hypothetical protein
MATPNETPPPSGQGSEKQNQSFLQKLREQFLALPRATQIVLVVVAVGLVFMLFSKGGREEMPSRQQEDSNITTQRALQQEEVFQGLEIDTPELLKSWFDQGQRDLADLKDRLENRLEDQDQALSQALSQNMQLQQEMKQILEDFKSEIMTLQDNDQRDREVLGQLAEETRKLQLNAPAQGQVSTVPQPRKRGRISQTPLGSPGQAVGGQPLLAGVVNKVEGAQDGDLEGALKEEERRPFLPPLGFVKATLLNGLDALVGGPATPSLARLHGVYKTAMNSTVNLDGCFVLIEFNGEISTERAVGKPSRMTCVYPDRGAVTYSLSGYVVDAEDGIIGVPGIFYEGDASRLAAAMLADFAAGVAQVVEQNESTFTISDAGTSRKTLTGDQLQAEIAGGVESSVGSLRDYLFDRANRVLPFVRIDATRTLHLVFLSGVELRPQGDAWTLLFSADE